jgi:rhodanese-related sulfurtransferase
MLLFAAPAEAQSLGELRAAISIAHPDVRWVDAPTLARWVEERPVVLLDARAIAEHRVSHLASAAHVDPDRGDLSGLEIARDARVVVYCSVGWRSAIVAERLRRAGFRDVYNLEGGIFGWANAGRPVFRGTERVRVVHPYDAVWGRLLSRPLHRY